MIPILPTFLYFILSQIVIFLWMAIHSYPNFLIFNISSLDDTMLILYDLIDLSANSIFIVFDSSIVVQFPSAFFLVSSGPIPYCCIYVPFFSISNAILGFLDRGKSKVLGRYTWIPLASSSQE